MAERDIFGTPGTEPDISTDALQWEDDDATGEPLPTGDESTPSEADQDNVEVIGGIGTDEDEDSGDEDPPSETDENAELPEALRGKSPAELAKIIADSQAMIQRQADEVGEARRLIAEVAARQNQQPQTEMVPAAEYIETTQDGLLAYREGIALLDQGQVGPDAIDEIIDVVREIDPATAAKMDRDFGMRLARAEMNVHMAPVIEQSYQAALAQATTQVNADPDAQAYREDIVRIVQSPANMIEQQVASAYSQARGTAEIAGALNAALQVARGANPVKSVQYKAQLNASKRNEQVEGGNSSTAAPSVSEEDRIKASILGSRQGSDDIFAGFGKR